MSDDEYGDILDDFADVQDVDWGSLLGGPAAEGGGSSSNAQVQSQETPNIPPSPAIPSTASSSDYFSDEPEMDSAFLEELDRVERQLTQARSGSGSGSADTNTAATSHNNHNNNNNEGQGYQHQNQSNSSNSNVRATAHTAPGRDSGPSSSVLASAQRPGAAAINAPQPQSHRIFEAPGSHSVQNRTVQKAVSSSEKKYEDGANNTAPTSNVPSKRPCLEDASPFLSPKKKGKMKVDDTLAQIISGYEDELTCPICCDIFVAAHVGNPCGHTFCGECGWQWHANGTNEKKGCPCCRQTLDKVTPMIPNVSMDNVVEKHVRALAISGVAEWEPGGSKYQEWDARKRAWRDGAEKRAKRKARQPAKAPQPYIPLDAIQVFETPAYWFVVDDAESDPDYVEEGDDMDLIPRPIRRARRGGVRG